MSKARELAELGAVYDSGALSNRNFIINGEMQCWQRATAATAANNSYNTVDRFRPYLSGGAYTTERSTDNPNGSGNGYSLKCQVTTADTSIAAGEYAFINHEIEAQNLQHLQYGTSSAKNVTLSFWVKSNKTGTYTVGVFKHANGATSYMYRREYTIDAADTWEKKEFTISPTAGSTTFMTSSGGAIANNNGNGFGVSFNLMLGSNFHGTNDAWAADAKYGTSNQVNWMDSTSNNFYITQIQMEVGEAATPFEHRSYANELRQCQRYYWEIAGQNVLFGHGFYYGTTEFDCRVNFPVEMRASPSLTSSNNTNDFGIHQGGDYFPSFSGIQYYNGEGLNMYVTSNVSGTNGEAKYCAGNQSTAKVQFSAEL
jgi:hypothetical protein|tara:strand:- start:142 stop:1251 length:1110 start_codon:yes stop_codon:yes gene_type:complete